MSNDPSSAVVPEPFFTMREGGVHHPQRADSGRAPNWKSRLSSPGGVNPLSVRLSVYVTSAPTMGAPCRYFASTLALSVSP